METIHHISNRMRLWWFFLGLLWSGSFATPRTLKWYSLREYEKAKCLSGESGAYYFSPGSGDGESKVVFHLEGGNLCFNVKDCAGRAKQTGNEGGKTSGDDPTKTCNDPYFSDSPVTNPLLYNWNIVYLRYCDGGHFGSDVEQPIVYEGQQIYYRGMEIVKAGVSEVMKMKPKDVVITGFSSGAVAVIVFADAIAGFFKAQPGGESVRISAFSDSGFYTDFPGYATTKKYVIEGHKVHKMLQPECKQKYQEKELYKCMVAELMARDIKTPMFVWQSKTDGTAWAATEKEISDGIYNELISPEARGNGAFVDACSRHGWGQEVIPWAAKLERTGEMLTALQAHELWYTEKQTTFLMQEDCNRQACAKFIENPTAIYDYEKHNQTRPTIPTKAPHKHAREIWQYWEYWVIVVLVALTIPIICYKLHQTRTRVDSRDALSMQELTATSAAAALNEKKYSS